MWWKRVITKQLIFFFFFGKRKTFDSRPKKKSYDGPTVFFFSFWRILSSYFSLLNRVRIGFCLKRKYEEKTLKEIHFFEIQTRLGDVGGDNIWRQSKVIDERTLFKSLFEMTRCPLSLSSVFFRIGSLKKKKVLIARISDRTAPRTSSYSHFLFIFNGAKFKKKYYVKITSRKFDFKEKTFFRRLFIFVCVG